jgi:hypothetical protein
MAITAEKSQNHYTPRRLIEAARTLSAALAPYEPETIDIGGVRVNAGMREAPEMGHICHSPDFSHPIHKEFSWEWDGGSSNKTLLLTGMCCRTPEDAIAMHDAIVRQTGVAG